MGPVGSVNESAAGSAHAGRAASRPLPPALLAVGYLLFAVAGALAALLDVTLIPTRYGTTLVPIAPVLTLLGGVLLPAIARGLTDTMPSAAPPVITQVLTIWLLATGRPEGDVLMPAGGTAGVAYAVLLLGTLVPLTVLGLASRPGVWHWPERPRFGRRRRLNRPPAGPGSGSGGAR